MNVYERMIRALQIFDGYEHDRGFTAEHDEVWAGPDPDSVSAEDLAELEALGWSADRNHDCFHKFV